MQNQGWLSQMAYGALVMGGVPLQDWPEITEDVEFAHRIEKKKKPHSRNLFEWFKSGWLSFETRHPAAAH